MLAATVGNLLHNASKFTIRHTEVWLRGAAGLGLGLDIRRRSLEAMKRRKRVVTLVSYTRTAPVPIGAAAAHSDN
jgi:hypothetical protein